jgi:hypothetical protein
MKHPVDVLEKWLGVAAGIFFVILLCTILPSLVGFGGSTPRAVASVIVIGGWIILRRRKKKSGQFGTVARGSEVEDRTNTK